MPPNHQFIKVCWVKMLQIEQLKHGSQYSSVRALKKFCDQCKFDFFSFICTIICCGELIPFCEANLDAISYFFFYFTWFSFMFFFSIKHFNCLNSTVEKKTVEFFCFVTRLTFMCISKTLIFTFHIEYIKHFICFMFSECMTWYGMASHAVRLWFRLHSHNYFQAHNKIKQMKMKQIWKTRNS